MEEQIIIKKQSGKSISVTATSADEGIVLTRTGDKSDEDQKKRIIIEPIDIEIYQRFQETQSEAGFSARLMNGLKNFLTT